VDNRQERIVRASSPSRSGSLSDRVKASQPVPKVRTEVAESQPSTAQSPSSGGVVSIEQVRASWDQIRANLKARSRRVEALLMSVDPASVNGNLVTLTSAYPFHRNKLNESDVQQVVEEAISDVVGSRVRVTTLLHGEGVPQSSDNGQSGRAAPVPTASPQSSGTQLEPDDQKIIDTVKNMLDAEEI
jgi:hypothetical protein